MNSPTPLPDWLGSTTNCSDRSKRGGSLQVQRPILHESTTDPRFPLKRGGSLPCKLPGFTTAPMAPNSTPSRIASKSLQN
ncbi:hypothetical protein cgR_5001 [Corynebacterium glutamicum R]|uniref:Uncharacterized protein n=1 Tax=Corynebacterium glutamicum (strain R) TaxID=340322 RepID=A0AB72V7L3_CORGB|nr:hypothetical protein cgR_5001 [Corynebacterium glutamicum R]